MAYTVFTSDRTEGSDDDVPNRPTHLIAGLGPAIEPYPFNATVLGLTLWGQALSGREYPHVYGRYPDETDQRFLPAPLGQPGHVRVRAYVVTPDKPVDLAPGEEPCGVAAITNLRAVVPEDGALLLLTRQYVEGS